MKITLLAACITSAVIVIGALAGPSRAGAPERTGLLVGAQKQEQIPQGCPWLNGRESGSPEGCPYAGSTPMGPKVCPYRQGNATSGACPYGGRGKTEPERQKAPRTERNA